VAIGDNAGRYNQNAYSVAVGIYSGQSGQQANAVAIGNQAGSQNQGSDTVSIGDFAGRISQNNYSVAVGSNAAARGQWTLAVALGSDAGAYNQGQQSVAIGNSAGLVSQKSYSIAIGASAGSAGTGVGSIIIGTSATGANVAAANTIVLNASGTALAAATASATYIEPIRTSAGAASNFLSHITSTGEVVDSGAITIAATSNITVTGNLIVTRRLFIAGNTINAGVNSAATTNLFMYGTAWKSDGTSTWLFASDEKIKDNIQYANLLMCYNTVKELPLSRYNYTIETHGSTDFSRLGWLAQNVQKTFPKSVTPVPIELPDGTVEDCLALNTDQIQAAMYGATQALMNKVETLEKTYQSGEATIPDNTFSVVVPITNGNFSNTSPIVATPIFNGTGVRTLNTSRFDPTSNSFTVFGAPGDFFWTIINICSV
jgi:hypothetical protein